MVVLDAIINNSDDDTAACQPAVPCHVDVHMLAVGWPLYTGGGNRKSGVGYVRETRNICLTVPTIVLQHGAAGRVREPVAILRFRGRTRNHCSG